jgi:hypothetical protein
MNRSRRTLAVLTLLCVAALADIATTVYGIETQSLFEANPSVRAMLETGGYPLFVIVKATAASFVFALYAVSRSLSPRGWEWLGYAPVFVWTAMHGIIAAHNTSLIVG